MQANHHMSYNQTMSLGASDRRAWRRNQNTVKFQLSSALGPISHTVIIAIMLCILGLLYLTQITKTSAYGYQINELEVKKDQLTAEKRDLEVENARLQALERVKQSEVAKALASPTAVDHVQ